MENSELEMSQIVNTSCLKKPLVCLYLLKPYLEGDLTKLSPYKCHLLPLCADTAVRYLLDHSLLF